ncbi:MAG: DNA sulfur modification protein DndB [Planctomycetes bacterium]|nr:DNA sulfur modification protein DndB [Planctomycetota bacterium]
MEEQSYTFSAIKGIQAKREYYAIMCPFKVIPKLFLFNEEEVSPDIRAQRILNKARIPEMARYVLENPTEYCFSAITASVNGDVKFTPSSDKELGDNIGKLVVGMSSSFIINDGQHRRAAIEEALKVNPELGNERISVVLFVDRGLKRCQQMFADLNKHAVRPSGSIGVLYDHRDPLSELTRKVMLEIYIFNDMIELERTSISNRSRKLFTLNSLYNANKALLGKTKRYVKITQQEENACIDYWKTIVTMFKDWKDAKDKKINPSELRRDYVYAHGVVLHALGIVGHSLLYNYADSWKDKIKKLKNINWRRSNSVLWEGRAMVGGRMTAAPSNLLLTSSILKQLLDIELSPGEAELEKFLNKKMTNVE